MWAGSVSEGLGDIRSLTASVRVLLSRSQESDEKFTVHRFKFTFASLILCRVHFASVFLPIICVSSLSKVIFCKRAVLEIDSL